MSRAEILLITIAVHGATKAQSAVVSTRLARTAYYIHATEPLPKIMPILSSPTAVTRSLKRAVDLPLLCVSSSFPLRPGGDEP